MGGRGLLGAIISSFLSHSSFCLLLIQIVKCCMGGGVLVPFCRHLFNILRGSHWSQTGRKKGDRAT